MAKTNDTTKKKIKLARTSDPTKVPYTDGQFIVNKTKKELLVDFGTTSADRIIISNLNAELEEAITTSQAVGGIAAGTTFNKGTKVEAILKQLFSATPVTGIKIYKGVTNTLPTTQAEIEALTLDQSKTKDVLLASGYTYDEITADDQYIIFAVQQSSGLKVKQVKEAGFPITFNETSVGDYYMYSNDYKATIEQLERVYVFKEV